MSRPQFAVTGGIACGKSEVGKLLTSWGVRVLDTDIVGHDVIRQGQPAYVELIETFGKTIRNPLGEIDRSILGSIVFNEPDARLQLNRIVHPRIRTVWETWVEARRHRDETAAVLIPLLFESNADWPWDAIVCISAPEPVMLQRLRGRGHSDEEAARRIAAQMPLAEKERQSDYIITNDKTLTHLEARTRDVLRKVSEGVLRERRNQRIED